MATPDRNLFAKAAAFTRKIHRDVYAAIDPTKSELSQTGKVVVITGATRGLGQLAFAASFARAKAKAIVLLGRSMDALAETEKIVTEINPATEVHSIVVDVVDEVGVAKGFDEIESRFGAPHVLINNAGILGSLTPMVDADIEAWWKTQEVNVKATFLVTKAFLSKTGPNPPSPTTIINMISGGAVGVPPGMSAYAISKLAVTKFTSYLQSEHPTITSVSLDPGVVATDMGHSVPFLAPFIGDTYALVGGAAVWLASGDKAFLSGRVFSANWDVEELDARKQEIVEKSLLTISYRGDFGGPDVIVE
ncbi:putative oxidoreductase [Aspergillus granulosus]|uniref:Oxidoreductase n=1 Tax=Aspergillus granulosus TaxID=176169 RepID=A0ABR4GXQ1_9EURO